MIARRAALGLPFLALPVRAQESWPARPIRFVVPFAAGSATDLRARLFAEPLARRLGQPVVVENRGGANGFLASEAVARARPDGYTFLFTANTTHASNPALFRRLPYDPINDFMPVALLGTGVLFVVVNNSLPIQTMRDLAAAARQRPGGLDVAWGSASSRVAAEMFRHMAGVPFNMVAYRANPQGITDVIAGNVQAMFLDTTTAMPQVREGRVRALAVTSRQRLAMAPDVPTVAEAAGLPDYEILTWNGVFAPANTPVAIVDRVAALLLEIMVEPATTARYLADGNTQRALATADFGRFVVEDIARWTAVVAAAGIERE